MILPVVSAKQSAKLSVLGGVLTLVGIILAGSALLLAIPEELIIYLISSALLLLISFFSIRNPIFFLSFIILTSATAGIGGVISVEVGGTSVSISGLLWMFVALMAFLILTLIRPRLPRKLTPLIFFVLWVVICWGISGPNMNGLKDILFYSMPPLLGTVAYTLASRATGVRAVERMEKAILYSAFVPLTLYMITISLGAVVLTHVGPVGFVQPRPVALYLLVVLALALANWRYGATAASRRLGFMITLIALGIVIFTLSRTAALVGLLMVPLSRSNPTRIWTTVIGAILGVVVAGSLFFAVPALQQRLFFKTDIKPSEALQYLNTSGRSVMWSETYSDAVESPLLGHGPGSARILLGKILYNRGDEGTHPHNEYLQVFHDMGLVGLVLFIMAWVTLTFQFWRTWKHAVLDKTKKLTAHKWSMAALLCLVAIISTAVTDNTIHYAFVMAPAFIIVGIALRCARGDM